MEEIDLENYDFKWSHMCDDNGRVLKAGDTVCLNGQPTQIGQTEEGDLYLMNRPKGGVIRSLVYKFDPIPSSKG